jgi:hypothetical protein
MPGREKRIAKNEALFRGVNERVRNVKAELPPGEAEQPVDFICECGRDDCVEEVPVTLAEYERTRAEPTHFLVRPGHEVPDVEVVVLRSDRFLVVKKFEEEAEVARETDPRN